MAIIKHVAIWICLTLGTNCATADQKLVFSTNVKSDKPIASELILREAYKRLGYDIEVRSYPPARSLFVSNSGDVDGEVHRLLSTASNSPNLIPVPVHIHKLDVVVFGKTKAKEPFNNWETLLPYKVGLIRGHIYAREAIERYPQMRYEQMIDPEQLLKMVSAGRIDYAVLTKWTGLKILNKLQMKEVSLMEGTLETYELFHYLHKKNKHLVPEIERMLKSMSDSGEIHQIRTEYAKRLNLE